MKLVYAGIDPGKTGAIALLTAGDEGPDEIEVYPCPEEPASIGTLLRDLTQSDSTIVLAAIERVHAFPKQGSVGNFTFGTNFGAWQAAMGATGVPFLQVLPRAWQKRMLDSCKGDTKSRSLSLARRLFPQEDLSRKKDDGKADAIHLARYARLVRQSGEA